MKRTLLVLAAGLLLLAPLAALSAAPRVVEIKADKHSRFHVLGQKKAEITVKAGERVKFRVLVQKRPWARPDGTVHTFTVKELIADGWHVLLKEGKQEFTLTAPRKEGTYKIECLLPCGPNHPQMQIRMVVH